MVLLTLFFADGREESSKFDCIFKAYEAAKVGKTNGALGAEIVDVEGRTTYSFDYTAG